MMAGRRSARPRALWQCTRVGEPCGYALAALLVAISVMAVLLSAAMPVWTTLMQREREAELVFRGEQYARAIARYQQQFANTPPPNLETLVEQNFLRRLYEDPMSPDGAFVPLTAADLAAIETARAAADGFDDLAPSGGVTGEMGGIVGVTSSSPNASLREYNGATRYNEWVFLASTFSRQAGLPGEAGLQPAPRGRGRSGLSAPITGQFPGAVRRGPMQDGP